MDPERITAVDVAARNRREHCIISRATTAFRSYCGGTDDISLISSDNRVTFISTTSSGTRCDVEISSFSLVSVLVLQSRHSNHQFSKDRRHCAAAVVERAEQVPEGHSSTLFCRRLLIVFRSTSSMIGACLAIISMNERYEMACIAYNYATCVKAQHVLSKLRGATLKISTGRRATPRRQRREVRVILSAASYPLSKFHL